MLLYLMKLKVQHKAVNAKNSEYLVVCLVNHILHPWHLETSDMQYSSSRVLLNKISRRRGLREKKKGELNKPAVIEKIGRIRCSLNRHGPVQQNDNTLQLANDLLLQFHHISHILP